MASLFDAIDTAGQAVITDRLGEAVTFIGMLDGEYSRSLDPMRPRQEATAVMALSPKLRKVAEGISGRSSTGATHRHMNCEMWMSTADFAALDWEPRRDDVVLVDAGTDAERRFSISAVMPLEQGDVQFLLSEGGRDK